MLASPLAYNIIRESGFLTLPSKRTLLDWSKPQPGFQVAVLEQFMKEVKVEDLNEAQRYIHIPQIIHYIHEGLIM